jgi:hypothetical protein
MPLDLRHSADVAEDLVAWLNDDDTQALLADYLAAVNTALDGGHTLAASRVWKMTHDITKYPKLTTYVFQSGSTTKRPGRGILDRDYDVAIALVCRVSPAAHKSEVDPLDKLAEAITELLMNDVELGESATTYKADYTGPLPDPLEEGLFLAWIGISAGSDDD